MNLREQLFEATANRDWVEHAACRGMNPALFFAGNNPGRAGNKPQVAHAVKVCAGCPVKAECLDYALNAREIEGVWGGEDFTRSRRRALVKVRAVA